jgi:hypothetical protein
MNAQELDKEFDPNPLVQTILEKSKAGKLAWEDTPEEDVFVASVGGNTTLKIGEQPGDWGKQPQLSLLDENGKVIWDIYNGQVRDGLWSLFNVAKRVALKLDDKVEALMDALQKL